MTRHPLDHDHGASTGRLKKFIEVERANAPRPASKTLQQRAHEDAGTRLEKFTRIERGVRA